MAQALKATATSCFVSEPIHNLSPDKEKSERHPTLLQETYPKARLIPIPKTLKQAQKSKYWPEFETAMTIELTGLDNHDTFHSVPDKKHYHKIGTKWVYDIKHDADGNITRFKARLVAQGFTQIPEREFGKTYAPVCSMMTIMILFVIAVTLNLSIFLLDFKGAFLHSFMPKQYPVYIAPHMVCMFPQAML